LMVLAQANPGSKLPRRDYGFYVYIGEQILHGKLPYRDAWESKPPAIFYLNAVGLWIGHGSRWGVWAVEFVTLSIAIWVSYFLLKKLWGMWPALLGMLLWLYAFDKALMGGNLTEEYPMPLHFISLLLFLELLKRPRHKIFCVNNNTEPGELVLFWGAYPGENYMSNRETPTSVLDYPLLLESDIARKLSDRFLEELTEKRVVLIVDMDYGQALSLDPAKRLAQREANLGWKYPPHNLDEVFKYIETNYYVEAVINGNTVYRLYGTK